MTEDDLKSLIYKEDSEELKDDALQQLLNLDSTRITGIKDNFIGNKDEQYKRALRETSERWEKDIKKAFNLETDLIGDELIAEVVKTKSKGSGDGKDDLTDDKVKAHPLYIDLNNSKVRELSELKKQHQTELETKDNEFNSRTTLANVNSSALSYVRSKNPILPEDVAKAGKRLNSILPELGKYDFEKNGDSYIVKNKDGSQLVDTHNNPVSFEELLDNVSDTYLDFEEKGDGNKGKGTGNQNKFGKDRFKNMKVPQNHDDLQTALANAKDSDERAAISKAYLEADKTE